MHFLAKHLKIVRANPLAARLLFYILLCSSIISLTITLIQLFVDYRKDMNIVEVRLAQIGYSYQEGLARAQWHYDLDQTKSILKGIEKLPDIKYAVVKMPSGREIMNADRPEIANSLSRTFPLIHKKIDMGKLEVIADLEGIYRRLYGRTMIILTSQTIKTFVVSAFILFIIQHILTRHLATMARFAQKLDLQSLDQQLQLNRKNRREGEEDELDRVVGAINEMVTSLQKSSKELEIRARMEGELNAAAELQRSFSPRKIPQLDKYQIASHFMPAREISGDYYDIIRISENHIALVVADVSGKGVSAAMYANIARVLLRDKAISDVSPVELLCRLNNSLQQEFQTNHFLTMVYVLLDLHTSTVTYANAGHEPLVLIQAGKSEYELLKPQGYPFSELHADIFAERLRQEHITMQTGDVILLYTDGLTDVTNEAGEMFGEERLYEITVQHQNNSAQQIQNLICNTLEQFQGTVEQTDDITMIVLKKM